MIIKGISGLVGLPHSIFDGKVEQDKLAEPSNLTNTKLTAVDKGQWNVVCIDHKLRSSRKSQSFFFSYGPLQC